MSHFDHEADMIDTRPRRPVVLARTTHGISAHQQNWRAANSPQYDDEGPLDAAVGIFRAVVLSVVAWMALGAVAVVLMGW